MFAFRRTGLALAISLASISVSAAQSDLPQGIFKSLNSDAINTARLGPASGGGVVDSFGITSREVNAVRALSYGISQGQPVLRGAKEADVYSSAVSGVVLVVSNDSIGAGAVVTRSGYIVTNMHVVGDAKNVLVAFAPRGENVKPKKEDLKPAVVVKVNQKKDLALLQVSNMPSSVLPIPLTSRNVRVGDDVHAIGHPRGQLWSYTKGYVSQLRKDYEWNVGEGIVHQASVIQTQTPINPGNSGGPLLNDSKELVGVNSFGDPKSPGLNYAVDVSDVRTFLKQQGSVYSKKASVKKNACGNDPIDTYAGSNSVQGEVTVAVFDSDCDGKPESELRIAKDKTKPNIFAMDTNGDGRFDLLVFDEQQDGKWDVTFFDLDHDGKLDAYARNTDGNLIASGELKPLRRG